MKFVKQSLHPWLRTACCAAVLGVTASAAMAQEKANRNALFDDDDAPAAAAPTAKKADTGGGVRGYLQFELARTTANPDHWSKMRTRADLSSSGNLGGGIKWKLGARADYDAVYDATDFYNAEVRRNQRFNLSLRENYIDINAGNWDFRLGRQHVVWGEMVGLFFADVVSARDVREYILPEFDGMRIPQWAARAEYFNNDFHAELLWIPVATYDQIGKPGGEFYPLQPVFAGTTAVYRQEQTPKRNLENGNYGLRLSTLVGGWDLSGFYYSSMSAAPTFYREAITPTTFAFQARHDRINQWGGTLAKDFGDVVLKSELVYTEGRRFTVLRVDPTGVVKQNTVDWAVGLDFSLPADTRLNLQVFQRTYLNYDQDIIGDKRESGYTILLNRKFTDKLEAQALFISSFNRPDWLFRPRVTWNFEKNWRLMFGADVFKGPPLGLFGQYDAKDRVYSEVRYSF